MAKSKKPSSLRWLFLLPIPILWWVLGYVGTLDFLEREFLNLRFRFRGEIDAPIKVIYVDVDSKSITDLGNQPWDRALYAEVCSALISVGKVKAIGVDYVFSDKGQAQIADKERFFRGNLQLARSLFRGPPVVFAAAYAAAEDRDINGVPIHREFPKIDAPTTHENVPEVPLFQRSDGVQILPLNIGLIDTVENDTRWVPLFAQTDSGTFYHMAVKLAQLYWGLPNNGLKVYRDRVELLREGGALQTVIPLTGHQNVEVNWFSPWISPRNPRISFSKAHTCAKWLAEDDPENKRLANEFFAQFKGSVVLIGPVDPLLQDLGATPFDRVPVPRVGIHGNLLKTIVSGLYLREVSPWGNAVIVFGLTIAVGGLAVTGGPRRGGRWRVAALALLVCYIVAAFLIFSHSHVVLPLAAPIGAALSTSFAGVVWKLVAEEKQKGRIKVMFGTYVSPELVDHMVESGEDPKLGGAEAQITAYFSDIQDFSTISEQLSATQLVELMNEYLTACTDIVTAGGGTLDKYIGDAVVAMFGAPVAMPDHAFRACLATELVQARLVELRKKWASEGDKWPASVRNMHTRIGLNSGPAVVGNMGSLTRFNYTMMGDSVNLAARMESGAKSYGAGTMVTEGTKLSAEKYSDRCVFRFLDRIVVKGRTQPVAIYEIVGLKESLPPQMAQCIAAFNTAMERYRRQEWDDAIGHFKKSAELEIKPDRVEDTISPSSVYLQRCEVMKLNPPGKNWDGVFVMRTK